MESHARSVLYLVAGASRQQTIRGTDNGLISAFNATTGEPHYAQVRLPKSYKLKASPVGANGNYIWPLR